jgi:hypothetical protein
MYILLSLPQLLLAVTGPGSNALSSSAILHNLPQIILAVGGLGTTAFGLVDATKVFWGGVNRVGFKKIAARVRLLTPSNEKSANVLPQNSVINTLKGNWYNGTDLNSQKAIAKSLIRLNLNTDNAPTVAAATNVDSTVLASVAKKQVSGDSLTPDESDAFARYDLIVTAMLDETYQMADQEYRNATRGIAVLFAIGLSLSGWLILHNDNPSIDLSVWDAGIVGLLAAPLAPIAKDLSTALATAVNTLQAVKK